jgi:hypothetical protein
LRARRPPLAHATPSARCLCLQAHVATATLRGKVTWYSRRGEEETDSPGAGFATRSSVSFTSDLHGPSSSSSPS